MNFGISNWIWNWKRIKNEFCTTGQKLEAWPSLCGFTACPAWPSPSTVAWLAVAQGHWADPADAARACTGAPGTGGSCAVHLRAQPPRAPRWKFGEQVLAVSFPRERRMCLASRGAPSRTDQRWRRRGGDFLAALTWCNAGGR
jgi:hypothetical protein